MRIDGLRGAKEKRNEVVVALRAFIRKASYSGTTQSTFQCPVAGAIAS